MLLLQNPLKWVISDMLLGKKISRQNYWLDIGQKILSIFEFLSFVTYL